MSATLKRTRMGIDYVGRLSCDYPLPPDVANDEDMLVLLEQREDARHGMSYPPPQISAGGPALDRYTARCEREWERSIEKIVARLATYGVTDVSAAYLRLEWAEAPQERRVTRG